MAEPGIVYTPSTEDSPLRQGELLSGIVHAQRKLDSIGTGLALIIRSVEHPWVIVLSQDCDLDWDFKWRQEQSQLASPQRRPSTKEIPNVLLCEMVEAGDLHAEWQMGSREWKHLIQNKNERYHFLQKVAMEEDACHEGTPELCIDFKRYFTIPTGELYLQLTLEARRRCRLNSPYVRHLSSRFYNFQSRVALPEEHFSESS